MLAIIRAPDNTIAAACDWWLVDELGNYDISGDYVYLNQLEINHGVNLHRIRRALVRQIAPLVPHAVGVYWERRDIGSTRHHAFRREALLQLRNGHPQPERQVR